MEMEGLTFSCSIFPNRFVRKVNIVNSSSMRVNRDEASPCEYGTGAPNFEASFPLDHFPALGKRPRVRRSDSANGRAQHTSYTASLENIYEPFDDQTTTLPANSNHYASA
jgi:hypothetical protein